MARTTIALIGGIVLGALVAVVVLQASQREATSTDTIVRDIADIPKMDVAVAEQHRLESYAEIDGVDEIAALPTQFARAAATHAVASRLDSAGIQSLVFEVNRIADEQERVHLLVILFSRLAELDAQSALVLARTSDFASHKRLEQAVWNAWGHKDLDDALFAARTQPSASLQNRAAQALFAAFGYMGNETTERIGAELGIKPDRSTRARYLHSLADRSPAVAIQFINELNRDTKRREYVSWLAHYLSQRDPYEALEHSGLFDSLADTKRYDGIVKDYIARNDPAAVLDRLLADSSAARRSSEFHSAARTLAEDDIDAAKRYYEQARNNDVRMWLGSAIAAEMAKSDPEGAIAWAQANDNAQTPVLMMTVISQIAEEDPDAAVSLALDLPNPQMQGRILSSAVSRLARNNPVSATRIVEQVQNEQLKDETMAYLASTWMRQDPEAAVDWILSQDEEARNRLSQMTAHNLANADVDAAIRLLPRFDETTQLALRRTIAQNLAARRSPDEALAFIRQFEGQPNFEELQTSLISGVINTDLSRAKQLADQLPPGNARDMAYLEMTSRHSRTNAEEATAWLDNIADEQVRGQAAGQIAARWFASDADAATRWLDNLPTGATRDNAILQASQQSGTISPQLTQLIDSIEDPVMRGQAKLQEVYRVARTDPEQARAMLDNLDIPQALRQEAEQLLVRRVFYR